MDHRELSGDNGYALESVLCMNSGDGPNSYAANSSSQRDAMLKVRSILEESVKRVYTKTSLSGHFAVADLGCATGPNSLEVASAIIETITGLSSRAEMKSTSEILVFLNDLSGNDFNSIFVSLPDFYDKLKELSDIKCFVSAMPGSFFGRLFPNRSLHLVHSAMSLHWLSQVPKGLEHKGSISIASTSSDSVCDAYLKQFQKDFGLFLCSRANEIVSQGEMVLTFVCRITFDARDKDSVYYWGWLSDCLLDMADEGLVEEKDIDSFNLPFYMPSEEEVRDLVDKEASFVINKFETIQQNIGPFNNDEEETKLKTANVMALGMRAIAEPLLTNHFGKYLSMGDLFARVETKVVEYLSKESPIIWTFFILSATKI